MYEIIDAYPRFAELWPRIQRFDDDVAMNVLLNYLSEYKLLEILLEDLSKSVTDWRDIAKQVVLPKLRVLGNSLGVLRDRLILLIPRVYDEFMRFWGLDIDVVFVVYVGLYCGAGWAYEYRGKRAVLPDLLAIADLGWDSEEHLKGLLIHEMTHLVHGYLRGLTPRQFEDLEEDPLALLYIEGYAMRGEHLVMGKELWRIANDREWVSWCRSNLGLLAREYLRRVENGMPVNDFFGSWPEFMGKSQVGYFLGHEFVKALERRYSFKEIATLPIEEVKEEAIQFLRNLATSNS